MPNRAARRRAAPAPDGTWARCCEAVFCHEDDAFPRIFLFFPAAIGLIFGFVFSLSTTLTAAPGVKPAFAAAGFVVAALCAGYALAGLPAVRRDGLAGACAGLARTPQCAPCAAPRPPPRESAAEFELPPHAEAAAAAGAGGGGATA